MKEYELTVLIHPDLEVDLEAPLDKVRKLVKDSGGKVLGEDNWGKKKLAYRINGQDFAVYVALNVELPAEAPLKISNTASLLASRRMLEPSRSNRANCPSRATS